ncbi:twitchin [Trichonephila clavata]|uniref:Twitchin n=1 Tax=Trichonephila clavata TaxID=2740835 RepID=A0A8X6K052_TRICU|nr:twitchin [Trichonephila clavata]
MFCAAIYWFERFFYYFLHFFFNYIGSSRMLQQPVVTSFKNHLLTLAWPSATMYEYPEDILYSIELLNATLLPKKWIKIASAHCVDDGRNYLFADILFYLQGTFQFRVRSCYKNGLTNVSKPSALFNFKAGNEPPKFCQNLKPIVINAGESLSISAKIQGEPTPKISWNLRNKPILPSKYVFIENTPYYTRLVCFNVRQSHSGIYEIKAVNEHGTDTTCVEVTVIDPTDPIFRKTSLNYDYIGEELNILSMPDRVYPYDESINVSGPPDSTGAPEISFKDNYCLELLWTPPEKNSKVPVNGYIIEAKDGPFGMPWRKIATTQDSNCHAEVYFYVQGLYSFRVRGFNKVWKGKPSEASKPMSSIIKSESPKFYFEEFHALVINVTESFGFLIKIQGEPPPNVTWYKDGKPIETVPDLIITNTLYDAGLICNCAQLIHCGTYQVSASNVYGSFSAFVDVNVIENLNDFVWFELLDRSITVSLLAEDPIEITNNYILDNDEFFSLISEQEASENEISSHASFTFDSKNCELPSHEISGNQTMDFNEQSEKIIPFIQGTSTNDDITMTNNNIVSEQRNESLQWENKDQSSELRIPSTADFIPKSPHEELIGTCNDNQSREEHSLEIHANEKDSNKLVSEKKSTIPYLSINKCYEFNSEEIEKNLEFETVANVIAYHSTDPPSEPKGPLLVSNICKTSCELKWDLPDSYKEPDLEGYFIEKLDPDSDLWVPEALISDTEIKVSNLIPGKSYEFRVKAFNQMGESKPLQSARVSIPGESCDIYDSSVEETNITDIPLALLHFCNEKLYTDVEIYIYDKTNCLTLYAHKLILSLWSPVFADQFSNQYANDNFKITVIDIAPQVFEVMLKFMYGVSSDFYQQIKDLDFVLEVYKAAITYSIEELTNTCHKIFLSCIPNAKNVFQLLDAGTLIGSETVRNRCLKILQTQTIEVLAAQGMSSVTISMVETILNIPSVSFPSEYELIKWVLDWATQTTNQREVSDTMRQLRPLIDFMALSAENFGELFKRCNELMSKEDGFNIFMNILIPGSCELPNWCSSSLKSRNCNK